MKSILTAGAAAIALLLAGCGDGAGNGQAPAGDNTPLKQIAAPSAASFAATPRARDSTQARSSGSATSRSESPSSTGIGRKDGGAARVLARATWTRPCLKATRPTA